MVASSRGFSLIELMIAILLGILVSIGLVTVFGATSKTSRVQQAMSVLQENGRYAISRINSDLRMVAHQQLNISGFVSGTPSLLKTPDGVVNPTIAANVYVDGIALPDGGNIVAPLGWPTDKPWPLSQRVMLQGYECSSGTCAPALPTGMIPAAGLSAGDSLGKSDVLTVRYLNASGWSMQSGELKETTDAKDNMGCAANSLVAIQVNPAVGSPALNFSEGDLALLVSGSRADIFRVTVAGNTLTVDSPIGGSVHCFAQPTATSSASVDATLYNFSRDFITTTYFVKLDADPNNASRVIPALIRRQSSIAAAGADQEIIQGAEQLDVLFGAQRANGKVSYLTADDVETQSDCPPAPSNYVREMKVGSVESGCLWRAIKTIEAHLLVDSINNMDLTPADMAYQYTWSYTGTDLPQTAAVPATTLPNGLTAGRMLRREFVSLVSLRNYNP
ncbi:MAG TPA: PilW family protein [Rudaea sp.]|nr:PilW family protein [Rudaea sp.]